MTTDNRFALDAAAVVQQLSREIAGMQARAVAQRALVEAAASLQRPELGGAGICLLQKLARTETGSRPQSGELAAPMQRGRDLVGQRARQWLQSRKYEVPR